MLWILCLLFVQTALAQNVVVFESTEPAETRNPLAGLQLKNAPGNVHVTTGFTFCVRFNFKLLGIGSRLFQIGMYQ
jgi:hypothetical protein